MNANKTTREYLDSLMVEQRLIDAVAPDTTLHLFGETFKTPVMMAALSHLNNCWPDGMVEMAKGAAAAGAVMWAGMGDEAELDRIVATGAHTVKIIKPYEDEEMIYRKIRHAEACGCMAVGMDIDHAFGHDGNFDNVLGWPMTPKSLEDIKGYVRATKLPFVIKGVLSVQDAVKCLQAGAQGIVVSHHHGILDSAVPPLMILPRIVEAVGGRMAIFADCGFETGMDVFKGMALGATAVSVGRMVMDELHKDGAAGIVRVVEKVTGELKAAMGHTAMATLADMDPSVIWEK